MGFVVYERSFEHQLGSSLQLPKQLSGYLFSPVALDKVIINSV